jgi:general secretion pathway protein G
MRETIELFIERCKARRTRAARHLRPDRGMTLLEIMIVLALIGLVMVAIVGGVIPAFNKGKIKIAKTAAEKIAGSVAQYSADNEGKCPTIDELVASGFMQKGQVKDPWGSPYMIKDCTGPDGAHITSFGPDKQEGTADDIKSAE